MYKFGRGEESVEAMFREVALSQLDEALAELARADAERGAVIHEARRRCKKLRALLRLVRPEFADYHLENAALRDAAGLLSHLRDTDVLRQTVTDLARLSGNDRPVLEGIAARLAAEPPPEAADAHLAQFQNELLAIRGRAAQWTLKGDRMRFAGLRRTYRGARGLMAAADRSRSATDFHEWRKLGKAHGHQVDLLKRIAPDVLGPDLDTIDRLSQLLGRHHDLDVLSATAKASPERFGDEAALLALENAAQRLRIELEAEAFSLGRQLFAERPRALARRFRAYWRSAQ